MNIKEYDICIIGAGIIDSSIARELAQYNKKIVVLEANLKVGLETSSCNSGLVHGGFDRLDLEHIDMLYTRGIENGLEPKELKILSSKKILKREPKLSSKIQTALLCNSSIAVDPVGLTETLMRNAIKNGVDLKLNLKVIKISKKENEFEIMTNNKEIFKSKIVIICACHYADTISKMAEHDEFELVTKRGEYRVLEKTEAGIVNSVVFMVPTIHGKGIIVAPTLDGHILVGPTSEDFVPKDETRLVTKEKYDLIGEIGKKIIPTINMNKTCQTFSGSRPIEQKHDNFWIKPAEKHEYFINVAVMKSPGLSADPAIADLVIEFVKNVVILTKKEKWDPIEKNPLIYKK